MVALPPSYSEIDADKLLRLVSDWRVSQKLYPIVKNQRLCDSATVRAVEIQQDCEVGENLAEQFKSEHDIFIAWLNSPSHLEVMASRSYHFGCVAQVEGYVVLHLSNVRLK